MILSKPRPGRRSAGRAPGKGEQDDRDARCVTTHTEVHTQVIGVRHRARRCRVLRLQDRARLPGFDARRTVELRPRRASGLLVRPRLHERDRQDEDREELAVEGVDTRDATWPGPSAPRRRSLVDRRTGASKPCSRAERAAAGNARTPWRVPPRCHCLERPWWQAALDSPDGTGPGDGRALSRGGPP